MMIWKACLAANGKPPIPKIAEERVRIAETAKCKKRTRADFVGRERSALAAETAEPKQSSRGSKNRILIELPDRLERSRRLHQKDIQVAGELEMLKTVIQKKNVDGLPRLEPAAFGEAVLPDTK